MAVTIHIKVFWVVMAVYGDGGGAKWYHFTETLCGVTS